MQLIERVAAPVLVVLVATLLRLSELDLVRFTLEVNLGGPRKLAELKKAVGVK